MKKILKAPIPLRLEGLDSLVRLATSRSDVVPVLMSFKHDGKDLLAFFFSIPFLRGSLPIFAYTELDTHPPPFIAYTCLEREDILYVSEPMSGKYVTCPVVQLEEPPELAVNTLRLKRRGVPVPVSVRLAGLDSMMRLVAAMNDEASTPPIWHFKSSGQEYLAVFYMLMEYFDSVALPMLCYVVLDRPPAYSFLAYIPSENHAVEFRPHVSDLRHFYGRIIHVKDMPFKL
ncbi:hypothetical protein HRbin01_00245 [archaeon HR01]|nr:hypothetical protein HRbin01_00245 [archaeon HR01]